MKKYTSITIQLLLIPFLANITVAMEQSPLLSLPQDMFLPAFFPPSIPLKENLSTSSLLRTTSKQLNNLCSIEILGKHFYHYLLAEKNKLFNQITKHYLTKELYYKHRNRLLILIHSGAMESIPSLLNQVVDKTNDLEMIKLLFKKGAKSNQTGLMQQPLFFKVTDSAIAQEFIDNGFNPHTQHHMMPNVLWAASLYNHPHNVTQFYINLGLNIRLLDDENNCILHDLTDLLIRQLGPEKTCTNYIKNCELLIKNAPDLILCKNDRGITPLEQAKKDLVITENSTKKKLISTIVELLEKYHVQ